MSLTEPSRAAGGTPGVHPHFQVVGSCATAAPGAGLVSATVASATSRVDSWAGTQPASLPTPRNTTAPRRLRSVTRDSLTVSSLAH